MTIPQETPGDGAGEDFEALLAEAVEAYFAWRDADVQVRLAFERKAELEAKVWERTQRDPRVHHYGASMTEVRSLLYHRQEQARAAREQEPRSEREEGGK